MDNIYTTKKVLDYGSLINVITIHRKPSEIPMSLDRQLSHLSQCGFLNGPENYVEYRFIIDTNGVRFQEAKKVLDLNEWKEEEVHGRS